MSKKAKRGKDETLRAAVEKRVEKEERAYRIVEKMVLTDVVDREFFVNAGSFITMSQYKDIIEERAITKLCGYPLCGNKLTQNVLKQKYKISLKEKKVYDLTERKNFCNGDCYKASKYYESQLSGDPVWMRNSKKSLEIKLVGDSERPKLRFSGAGEEIIIGSCVNQHGGYDNSEKVQEMSKLRSGSTGNESVDQELLRHYKYNKCTGDQESCSDDGTEYATDVCSELSKFSIDDNAGVHIDYTLCDGEDQIRRDRFDENNKNKQDFDDITGKNNDGGDDDDDDDDSDDEDEVDEDEEDDDDDDGNDDDEQEDIRDTGISQQQHLAHERNCPANNPKEKSAKRISSKHLKLNNEVLNRTASSQIDRTIKHTFNQPGTNILEGENKLSQPTVCSSKHEVREDLPLHQRTLEKDTVIENNFNTNPGGMIFGENELTAKTYVDNVYQTLTEWCGIETREYCNSCLLLDDFQNPSDNEECIDASQHEGFCAMEELGRTHGLGEKSFVTKKKYSIPSIDSKSPISIRGKIVSEKINKALLPMLSRLGLTFSDISCDVTNILKTLRFSNKNIVLKPGEWTLAALTFLLTLIKCSTMLKTLLRSHQKELFSLLDDIDVSQQDMDRLVTVFIPKYVALSEPAVMPDPRKFDMEELD